MFVFVSYSLYGAITAMVLCDRSQDSLLSVSVRMVPVVFSTTGFTDGGKPCHKTCETVALRRGIQQASREAVTAELPEGRLSVSYRFGKHEDTALTR